MRDKDENVKVNVTKKEMPGKTFEEIEAEVAALNAAVRAATLVNEE